MNEITKLFVSGTMRNIQIERHEIMVKFINRDEYIRYSRDMLPLLVTDKDVHHIIDAETGEILYDND